MKLHRNSGKPDWVLINQNKLNTWQRIASKSYGIITPANLASILGLLLVCYGLYIVSNQDYALGILLIAVGRILDVADGWIADKTGTKSPLGEFVDASIDKFVTGLTLLVLLISNIAPTWLLFSLFIPHLIIAVISVVAKIKNKVLQPSKLGKLSMAGLWLCLVLVLFVKALDISSNLAQVIYLISLIPAVMASLAAIDYSKVLTR